MSLLALQLGEMIQKLEKTEVNAKESFDKYSQLVSAQTSNSEDTSQLKNVRTTFNTFMDPHCDFCY